MVHSSRTGLDLDVLDGVGGTAANRPPRGVSRRLPMRAFVPAVARVVVTPSLWGTAVRQLLATSPPGWWRRAPFAPRPDRAYLRFRTETAYGPDARPGPNDLVAYLRWCKGRSR